MQQKGDGLALGRQALDRWAWTEARVHFEQTVASAPCAQAYEGLGWAAFWLDDGELAIRARETAFKLYRADGDALGAARMALWIGSDYEDFRGELAVARGWREKARRLLEFVPRAPEHAWLAMFEAEVALLLEADLPAARRFTETALTLARECNARDVEILANAARGLAEVEEGEVDTGMRRLDEAAASVLAGELNGFWACRVTCYLILACERVRDPDRAAEWCRHMREIAERTHGNLARGICLAHYAGVLIWRGRWSDAERELEQATGILRASRPPYIFESIVRQAELRRRQGRTEEAEDLFRQVEWHPLSLLGRAALRLEAGRPRDAQELVERCLRTIPETNRLQRASAIELKIRALALLGDVAGAEVALATLRTAAGSPATSSLRAAVAMASGVVALAAGEHEAARVQLEDAVALFERSGAPYEAALARLDLATTLAGCGRLERAREECAEAHSALVSLGASSSADRAADLREDINCRATARRASARTTATLTTRQVGILRLVARGMSDREIAAELGVSEHTVHRHVANILTRLDVRTRAAAVAQAVARGQL